MAAAAERRANELCRGLAATIKAQLLQEEAELKCSEGKADRVEQRRQPKHSPGKEARVSSRVGSPGELQAAQEPVRSVEPEPRAPVEHPTTLEQASPEVESSGHRQTADGNRFQGVLDIRIADDRGSLDRRYRRFDEIAAAEGSDSDNEVHKKERGPMRGQEPFRIAHRIAGVIEDIRESEAARTGSVASNSSSDAVELPKNGTGDVAAVASGRTVSPGNAGPSAVEALPEVRDEVRALLEPTKREPDRVRNIYSSDYSRFSRVADDDCESSGEEDSGGLLSRKTLKSLDAFESALSGKQPSGQARRGRHRGKPPSGVSVEGGSDLNSRDTLPKLETMD